MTACNHCQEIIPFDSADIVIAGIRFGSCPEREFVVHQTCIMAMLEGICRENLRFLARMPADAQP